MSRWRVNWRGPDVVRRVHEAVRLGIDDTMAASAIEAKQNHPGWQNRTGLAEGSVAIVQPAHQEGNVTLGRWGSQGVGYVIWLELKHGSFLRNSADRVYPSLKRHIQEHLR